MKRGRTQEVYSHHEMDVQAWMRMHPQGAIAKTKTQKHRCGEGLETPARAVYSDDIDMSKDASVRVGTEDVGIASEDEGAMGRDAGTGAAMTACCCGTTKEVSTGGWGRGVYTDPGPVGVDGALTEEGAGGSVGVGVGMLYDTPKCTGCVAWAHRRAVGLELKSPPTGIMPCMGNPDGKQNGVPGMPANCPGAITGMYITLELTLPSIPGTFAPLTAGKTEQTRT